MVRLRDEGAQRDLDDLMVALHKCGNLLVILKPLMAAQPGYGPRGGTIGRHAPESKEPWAAEASHAYWLIWFGSRVLADKMRVSLGLRARHWLHGENGMESVKACAPAVDDQVLHDARRLVQRWRDTGLQIRDIDVAERWVPVPRNPGTPPPACPYCRTMSLRLNRQIGEVRCMFPGCCDSGGNPTRARMQHGTATGQGMLVFGDDMTVSFSSAA